MSREGSCSFGPSPALLVALTTMFLVHGPIAPAHAELIWMFPEELDFALYIEELSVGTTEEMRVQLSPADGVEQLVITDLSVLQDSDWFRLEPESPLPFEISIGNNLGVRVLCTPTHYGRSFGSIRVEVEGHGVVGAGSVTAGAGPRLLLAPLDLGDVHCQLDDPCQPGGDGLPAPNPGETKDVAVMIRSYASAAAVSGVLYLDGWTLLDESWSCLPGQMTAQSPGVDGGTLYTTFDVLTGGVPRVIGWMRLMAPATPGCVELPSNVFDDRGGDYVLEPIGTLCVGTVGGPCFVPTPVAPTSWGSIKAMYRPDRR